MIEMNQAKEGRMCVLDKSRQHTHTHTHSHGLDRGTEDILPGLDTFTGSVWAQTWFWD